MVLDDPVAQGCRGYVGTGHYRKVHSLVYRQYRIYFARYDSAVPCSPRCYLQAHRNIDHLEVRQECYIPCQSQLPSMRMKLAEGRTVSAFPTRERHQNQ